MKIENLYRGMYNVYSQLPIKTVREAIKIE